MKKPHEILNYIENCPHFPLFVCDLFCGAGGTTTGIEKAIVNGKKAAKVVVCINHDKNAILSHSANHNDCLHFIEDIRTFDLTPAVTVFNTVRNFHPDSKIFLHASLECTNFSKAKGGQPRDVDSRTLGIHLYRYIEVINPDYIQIENVEEFMTHSWTKSDKNGKAIKDNSDFLQWVDRVQHRYGHHYDKMHPDDYEEWYSIMRNKEGELKEKYYDYDFRILNAADYGAYTSRKRFFGQFAKDGLPIAWPEPTHAKKQTSGLFGQLKKWKPVKDVLDFSDEGESIFTRKKPLSDKTLERIYAGLIKFVAGGKDNFLSAYYGITKNFNRTYEQTAKSTDEPCGVVTTENRFAKVQAKFLSQDKWLLKYNSINGVTGKHVPPSVDEPCPVIGCQDRLGIVRANFLSKYYSGHPDSKNKSIDEPADTVTAIDHHSLVSANFIQQRNGGNPKHKVVSVERPARTVTATGGNQELVQPVFLSAYYRNGHNHSVNEPCPVVTTVDRFAKVAPKFIINEYSGGGQHSSVEEACPAILTRPKQKVISCRPWIMNTNFSNVGSKIDEPAQTITANRKWHYLMNPQYFNAGGSVENPCFTIIARMDKMPPYLVSTEAGQVAIEVYETDTEPMRKIKEFMALYGIIDIKMRMLKIPELKRIMGFPEDYTLIGTQSDQKKYIGNAVEVNMARVLCEAMVIKLHEMGFFKQKRK